MSKAKLEFNLDEADDRQSFDRMLAADSAFGTVWDILEFLNREMKREASSYDYEMLEKINSEIMEIIDDNKFDMELYS